MDIGSMKGLNVTVSCSICGSPILAQVEIAKLNLDVKATCPKCTKRVPQSPNDETGVVDKRDNSDYLGLENPYKELAKEMKLVEENEVERLQEKIQKLENENRQLAQENEAQKNLLEKDKAIMEEKFQKLAAEVDHVRTENSELNKRVISAEVKVTLLTNKDLLEKKFGELKWSELTPEFQKELLGKLGVSGHLLINFDKILPINSKALMRLIKADEKDNTLLQKLVEDYYEEEKWYLNDSLRAYLNSKLRKTSQVESLKVNRVPISSKALFHIIKDDTENNPGLLGKIVTSCIDEKVDRSLALVGDLFKLALQEQIKSEVIGCVEVDYSDSNGLARLVRVGMLRKRESEYEVPYAFIHDTVRHCIIEMLTFKIMAHFKVSRMNAFQLFHGGYMSVDPLSLYFADYMSEAEQSCLAKFNFDMISGDTLESLIVILSVMRLPSLEPVIAILNRPNIVARNIRLSRKVPLFKDSTLTLLHAAAFRGDLERVKCLLYEFGFFKELSKPHCQNLGLACVENTKECSDQQIQERKEIIKELLKLNGDLVSCAPLTKNLNVHDDLIKFMIELGADSVVLS